METKVKRDGSGNLLSEKRIARRAAGWLSGRQWVKYRKRLRRAMKTVQTVAA